MAGVLCRIGIENEQTAVPEIMDLLSGLMEETSPNSKGTQSFSLQSSLGSSERIVLTSVFVFKHLSIVCTVSRRLKQSLPRHFREWLTSKLSEVLICKNIGIHTTEKNWSLAFI